jgi:hypothetical protein
MGKRSNASPRQSYGGESATKREPVTVDGSNGALMPSPPRKRVKHIKLETVRDVRDELARVYRAAKAGEIPPEVASRFTFMLGTLGKLITDTELEQRLDALEATAATAED